MNALILFVKYPEPGSAKTRLGTVIGMEAAASLYRQFVEATVSSAAALQSPSTRIFVWYAPGTSASAIRSWIAHNEFEYLEQRGESLGDRMQYAFQEVFRQGATKAVIVGTDIPELDLPLIERAFDELRHRDVVLGPSTDGGYYLLGMTVPGIDVFEGVPWSTPEVFAFTLRLVEEYNASVTILPKLSDIDTLDDYVQFRARQNKAKDTAGR